MVSNYESNLNFAAFGPRIVFALLAGYWSDKNGRKMLIGVPILGQIATSVVFIANWALLKSLPFEALYAELINEACGNFIVYYLGKCSLYKLNVHNITKIQAHGLDFRHILVPSGCND